MQHVLIRHDVLIKNIQSNLSNLKTEVHRLDIEKLETIPVD